MKRKEKLCCTVPLSFLDVFQFLSYICFGMMNETIPTTNKIGSAIPIRPANTRPIKNSGSSTMVHMIFDIPHAAFTAKPISFPNIRNIRMINSNVNMFFSPPRLRFFYHEILTYFQDQAFRCKLCARASFQLKDTF